MGDKPAAVDTESDILSGSFLRFLQLIYPIVHAISHSVHAAFHKMCCYHYYSREVFV